MSDYIPISRVFITYKPSSAEISTPTYSGIIIGEMKDLHYVANSANDLGHFTIETEDTLVEGKQFDITAESGGTSSPITVELSEYPGLKSGYEVDYDTVAVHSVHSNLLAMYRDASTQPADIATGKVSALIPMSQNTFVLYAKEVYGEDLTTFSGSEYEVTEIVTPVDGSVSGVTRVMSLSTMRTGKVIPGSYAFYFKLRVISTPATETEYVISDRDPNTGAINALRDLAVYKWDGAFSEWLSLGSATDVVLSNSYVNDYATNPGFSITMTFENTLELVPSSFEASAFVLEESSILKSASNFRMIAGIKAGDIITVRGGLRFEAAPAYATSAAATFKVDLSAGSTDIIKKDYLTALHTNVLAGTIVERTDVSGKPMVNATVKSVDLSTGMITGAATDFFRVSDTDRGLVAMRQYSIVYVEAEEDNRIVEATVTTTGVDEGKIVTSNQDSILSNAIVRGHSTGLTEDLWDESASPLPVGTSDATVLSGNVHVAYEALNKNERQYHNVLYVTRENYLDIVGKPDPRNPMGFVYDRTYAISQTDMYALITETTDSELLDALGILSNYENILHVYLIKEGHSPIFDAWVLNEAHPDNSRFRFGFNPTELIEYKTLLENEDVIGTIAAPVSTAPDPRYKFTLSSSVNAINLQEELVPGATMVFDTLPDKVFTVDSSAGILPSSVMFVETNATSTPVNTTVNQIELASLKLDTQALVDNMIDPMVQSSDNSYFMKIISGTIDYSYDHAETGETKHTVLSVMYNGILAYGVALGTYPQQPLTYIVIDGYGFGRVNGTTGRFTRAQFTQLVAAGYYTLTSTLGSNPEPYCLRDVTCGIARGTSLNGTFSKMRPVVIYAKDIYYITKQFLGRYNVVDDVIMNIQMRLEALRKRYTTKPIRFLGTRLAKATPAKFTKIPNGLKIEYGVSPQDPLITVDNYITVTDNTKEA